MCVIAVKPIGVAMPTERIIKTCFENNPNGAGFMFNHEGMVYGFKGFMKAKDLIAKLREVEKVYGDLSKKGVVLHFRIATHGKCNRANTHPFPLNGGYKEMQKLEWVAQQGFAHNGIIRATSYHDDVYDYNVSDTMVFGKLYASPVSRWADIATDADAQLLLGEIANSKLAFMDGDGIIATIGKFEKHLGILYSNDSYAMSYYDLFSATESKKKVIRPYLTKKALDSAKGLGLKAIEHLTLIRAPGQPFDRTFLSRGHYAYDPETGVVYAWEDGIQKWGKKYDGGIMYLWDDITLQYIFISKDARLKLKEVKQKNENHEGSKRNRKDGESPKELLEAVQT